MHFSSDIFLKIPGLFFQIRHILEITVMPRGHILVFTFQMLRQKEGRLLVFPLGK